MFLISPKVAYNFSELIEMHAGKLLVHPCPWEFYPVSWKQKSATFHDVIGWNQCWSGIVFFPYHWVSFKRISSFLIPVGYGCLTVLFFMPFGSIYHARTSIPRPNCPSINMVEIGIDSYKDSIQRFSPWHTHYSPPSINVTPISVNPL